MAFIEDQEQARIIYIDNEQKYYQVYQTAIAIAVTNLNNSILLNNADYEVKLKELARKNDEAIALAAIPVAEVPEVSDTISKRKNKKVA